MLKKYLTLKNFISVSFLVLIVSAFIVSFFALKMAIVLLLDAFVMLALMSWLEVTDLKDWARLNIGHLITSAEVASRAAYKLKQHTGKKLVINGKEVK